MRHRSSIQHAARVRTPPPPGPRARVLGGVHGNGLAGHIHRSRPDWYREDLRLIDGPECPRGTRGGKPRGLNTATAFTARAARLAACGPQPGAAMGGAVLMGLDAATAIGAWAMPPDIMRAADQSLTAISSGAASNSVPSHGRRMDWPSAPSPCRWGRTGRRDASRWGATRGTMPSAWPAGLALGRWTRGCAGLVMLIFRAA